MYYFGINLYLFVSERLSGPRRMVGGATLSHAGWRRRGARPDTPWRHQSWLMPTNIGSDLAWTEFRLQMKCETFWKEVVRFYCNFTLISYSWRWLLAILRMKRRSFTKFYHSNSPNVRLTYQFEIMIVNYSKINSISFLKTFISKLLLC